MPGTQGVRHDLLKKIEPFPTPDLVPYDAAMLSGFVVEHYQIVLLDAAERSIQQMRSALEALCAPQVPGDTFRNLEISPTFSDRTFKHVLLPVWLLTYNFGATAVPGAGEWIHGEDGRDVSGQLAEGARTGGARTDRARIFLYLEAG